MSKKTNFRELTVLIYQGLVDADLSDEQFDIIWKTVNDVYSKLKVNE